MRLDQILSSLKQTRQVTLRTADVMALLNVKKDHASHVLSRLAKSGHLIHLKRGLWTFADRADPLVFVEPLTAPFPSYVSVQSALHYHGMISQIPITTYCVSIARTRTYTTPIGSFSIHHVSGDFFAGYEETGDKGIKMATPEKALLDFLYLSPAKTRLFSTLPELELPEKFSVRKAKKFIKRVQSKRRRSMLEKRFQACLLTQ